MQPADRQQPYNYLFKRAPSSGTRVGADPLSLPHLRIGLQSVALPSATAARYAQLMERFQAVSCRTLLAR
jgi:hypothetical protein